MGVGTLPWASLCPQGPALRLLAESLMDANLLKFASCFPILSFYLSHPGFVTQNEEREDEEEERGEWPN